MKLSKRLLTIANYIDKEDKVVDVGCDHGYLDIYLALHKKNKLIIASDISPVVIKNTKENILKYDVVDKIKVYCTNGLENIKETYDTIVLSGLGAHTIIEILKKASNAKKIIVQSNNNWDMIRKKLQKFGYCIKIEKLIYESKKLYSIMLFVPKIKGIKKRVKMVGEFNKENIKEYKIWVEQLENVLKSIPKKYIFKRKKYIFQLKCLKKYLMKENRTLI